MGVNQQAVSPFSFHQNYLKNIKNNLKISKNLEKNLKIIEKMVKINKK